MVSEVGSGDFKANFSEKNSFNFSPSRPPSPLRRKISVEFDNGQKKLSSEFCVSA